MPDSPGLSERRRTADTQRMRRGLGTLACLLLGALASCGPTPRDQLERMGIPFAATSLLAAAEAGELHVVRLFLDAGMTPNGSDERRHTVLAAAARGGHAPVVAELLAWGADPNVGDDQMLTPLMHAAAAGHLEAARLLLGGGANADSLGADGLTVLMRAAANGHAPVVQALLDHGVDVNHGDAFGNAALLHAAAHGHSAVVAALLAGRADPDRRNRRDGAFPLGLAAARGDFDSVRHLLEAGADPELQELERGRTALALAAHGGHASAVRLLLERDADVSTRDRDGNTPLLLAVRGGHGEVVVELLAHRADPDARDAAGTTPLMFAAMRGDSAAVRALLAAGADATLEAGGYSALTAARREGHEVVAARLANAAAQQRASRGDARRWARFAPYGDSYWLPPGWTAADPMTTDDTYSQDYSLVGIDPGESARTRRALLRDAAGGSQILLVRGPLHEWIPRVVQRAGAIEAEAGASFRARTFRSADGTDLGYAWIERSGSEGAPARRHVLGIVDLGPEVLVVDAGGPLDGFDEAAVERFLGSIRLQPDTAPARIAPGSGSR